MIFELGDSITQWRIIDTDLDHPYYVTAADEALAISCGEYGGPPTLHFYRREPPGISVGYFRKVEEDVDIEKCKKYGIEIVRRSSGGGSIYTDKNQLILGLITNHRLGPDVEATFKIICQCLTNALDNIGIKAEFKSPNDIMINGKKISGSAQVKKKNAYIYHSTIILDTNEDIISQVLKNHKPGYITSIQQECRYIPDITILKSSIIKSFQDKFLNKFQPGGFSSFEKQLIQTLIKNKYSKEAWNFKR